MHESFHGRISVFRYRMNTADGQGLRWGTGTRFAHEREESFQDVCLACL